MPISRHPPRGYALVFASSAFLLAQVHVASGALALPLLLAGLAWAAWLGEIDFTRRTGSVEWAFALFAAAWLLTALWGRDPVRSLALSIPLGIAGLFGVVLGRGPEEALRRTWSVLLVAAAATAALVLLAWWHGAGYPQALVDRSQAGWLIVPNDLAFVACLWPLWWVQASSRIARLACAGAFLLQAAALLALHSRLGLLIAAISLLALAWRASAAWQRWLLGAAAALGALAIAALGKGSAGLQARVQLWEAAWRVFADSPFAGIGPHNFVLAYPHALSRALTDPRLTPWPHNLVLELLVGGGIVLLLASLLLVAFLLRSTCRRGATTVAMGGSVLLLCLLEASTLRVWLWVLVGLWMASASRQHTDPGENHPCVEVDTALPSRPHS